VQLQRCIEENQAQHKDFKIQMNITQWQNFLLFTSTLVFVGMLTPLMRKIAINREILDRPNSAHKSHKNPVPYLGGLAIILGIVFVTYGALLLSNSSKDNFLLATSLLGPALAMGLIGLWDDIESLHPFPRFVAQTISGVIVATILVLTNNFGNPTGSIKLDIFLTIIWIVGICNSINFFDNIDGGAAGAIMISALALVYLTINNNQQFIAAQSLVVAGATLGFLIWNRSPARIYMGDSGALFLGVLIATLTIRLKPQTDSTAVSFSIPVLLLAVPILDTAVAVVSRIRRNLSPFKGGKDHLSHRLIRAGLSRKKAVLVLWCLSAIFCLISCVISVFSFKNEIIIAFLSLIIWIYLFLFFIKQADS
jgi:UDP-GlcNAc:undecaprenyl-phosphate GlcNAc-1-phosphate transferase